MVPASKIKQIFLRPLGLAPAEAQGKPGCNEEGFVLVAALMILLILVLIGISATSTTDLELQITAADRIRRETFYAADAATELGALVLEENLGCPEGFATPAGGSLGGLIGILNPTMWQNLWGDGVFAGYADEDAFLDAFRTGAAPPDIQYTPPGSQQQLDIAVVGGQTEFIAGSALQIAAGYLGKGKGLAGGGGEITYDIYSRSRGPSSSETLLHTEWRHVVGQEGVCSY